MPKRETQTQFVARHARYQLAKAVLEHMEGSTNPKQTMERVKAMLKRIVERDGKGF